MLNLIHQLNFEVKGKYNDYQYTKKKLFDFWDSN